MLFASLLFSAVFLGGACAAYDVHPASRSRSVLFVLCGLLAVLFSAAFLNFLLFVQAVLLVIAGIVYRRLKATAGRFAMTGLACTLVSYFGYGASLVPTMRERQRIRERYPMESLVGRLAYEHRAAESVRPAAP